MLWYRSDPGNPVLNHADYTAPTRLEKLLLLYSLQVRNLSALKDLNP